MKAAILHGKHQLTVETVPDAVVVEPTDAVVRVVVAGICGTDIHGYRGLPGPVRGPRCGHEFVGVITDVGLAVNTLRPGMTVIAPFNFADGSCVTCRRGLPSGCAAGGMFGVDGDGGQAEAVRVPFADANLVPVAMDENDERLPSFLALSDVMATGLHAVRSGEVTPGSSVAIVGDGPVGLCAVLAAREARAERIMLLGRHESRILTGKLFGATDVFETHGPDGMAESVDFVRSCTGGIGADVVMECVSTPQAQTTAFALCRDGGAVSVVGGPPIADTTPVFFRNITLTGGLTPARAYLPELVDRVMAGKLDPGRIFDMTVSLDDIRSGYEAMHTRAATKVLVRL